MKPVEFEGQNTVYAKDQPEYLPLPAHVDRGGIVTSCWSLTCSERIRVLFAGKIWFQLWTFGSPLQPQRPSVERPFMEKSLIPTKVDNDQELT